MKYSRLLVSAKTAANIKEIYKKGEADRIIRGLCAKRLKLVASVLIITFVFAVPIFVYDAARNSTPVNELVRNGYQKGDRTVTLLAETKDGDREALPVTVSERRYAQNNLDKMAEKLDETLETYILGENHDLENVTRDLKLPSAVEGFPFEITWRSDKPLILSSGGIINKEKLSEADENGEGIRVCLCATLKYKDYTQDRYSYIVLKKEKSASDKTVLIENALKAGDEESIEEDVLYLPKTVAGERIFFYEKKVNRGFFILFVGTVAVFYVIAKKDEEIKREAADRRRQIEADHAGILNRYALYHAAGMNPRTIWQEISAGYEKRLRESKKNRRYAYDEMLITGKMMDEGVGELAAYDDHAARLGSMRYRSFISLIKQTVVNGSSYLGEKLEEEVEKARQEKLLLVKREAAEAQTKLLLPMFMMLIVVIVIVMVPAMIGLNEK